MYILENPKRQITRTIFIRKSKSKTEKFKNITTMKKNSFTTVESNPCTHKTCDKFEECLVDRYGEAQCVCPSVCPFSNKPVCGTDNITYESLCHLSHVVCSNKLQTALRYLGPCTVGM